MKKTLTGELTRLYAKATIEHHEMILREAERDSVSISVVIDKALRYYEAKKKVDRELKENN